MGWSIMSLLSMEGGFMFKVFILIIMVFVDGHPATVSEHKFNSIDSCLEARDKATDLPFRFGREVKAFCVKK
jgi:hypothetical protein